VNVTQDAEAGVLLALGEGDGSEEEAAEGDFGPAFVAEGVIDDDPDDASGGRRDRWPAKRRKSFGDRGRRS